MASFYLDQSTGKRYYTGRAFSYGDVNYSRQGATADTFASLGFQEVVIQQRPDDKYHIVSSVADDGSYASTPRDLDQLKETLIAQEKQTANSLLSPSDWMVIRGIENPGKPVTTGVSQYRADIRAACGSREAEIQACTTIEELEALMKQPTEFYDPETRVSTPNPDAMTQWPEDPDQVP